MGLLSNLFMNDDNSHYCPICNEERLYNDVILCPKCRQLTLINIKNYDERIQKITADIDRGYKKIEPYLSRYRIILNLWKEIYKMIKYVPNDVKANPKTYKTLEKNMYKSIQETIEDKKGAALYKFSQTGEYEHYKELKKLRDELLEMQIKYPEFRELLDISDLQQIIDCFPNKKMINN